MLFLICMSMVMGICFVWFLVFILKIFVLSVIGFVEGEGIMLLIMMKLKIYWVILMMMDLYYEGFIVIDCDLFDVVNIFFFE